MATHLYDSTYVQESKGTTPEGLPCAVISRECEGRRTVFFLVKRDTNQGPKWFSTGPQQTSDGKVRFFPERRGVRLTDSRLDRTLHDMAEAA